MNLLDGYDWLYLQTLKVCRALSKKPQDAPAAAVALMTALECWYVFGLLLLSDALLSTRLLGTGKARVLLELSVIVLGLGAANALYLGKRSGRANADPQQGRPDYLWLALFLGSVLLLVLGFGVTRGLQRG